MSKSSFFPELPCENLVRSICGENWRHLTDDELDGAWGVAIIRSVLDGVSTKVRDLSVHLGVPKEDFLNAYQRLSLNGCLNADTIRSDSGLLKNDMLAWCYYAGYASGAIHRIAETPTYSGGKWTTNLKNF